VPPPEYTGGGGGGRSPHSKVILIHLMSDRFDSAFVSLRSLLHENP
jgi:hypothetical protein